MKDPIEDWLGTDVELLSPRPGTFERIHRRARRRKAVVAATSAAAAAVVIAAAAALPQFASSLFPGHGGPNKVHQVASQSHTQRPSQPPSTTPSPHNSPRRAKTSPPRTGANLSISGSTVPATPGIAPSSVTFVNPSVGAVIGVTASSCPSPSGCLAAAATPDYGRTWRKVGVPPAGPPNGNSGVSQIRFLQSADGWAFGPELYASHDGGAKWAKISVPGRVIDLATVGGSAFAVVARCTGTGAAYASGCSRFSLYWSPYNVDNWQPVGGAAGRYPVVPGGLQLTGQNGYLLAGSTLFTGAPSGGPWRKVAISSRTVPSCLAGSGHGAANGESGVLAPGAAGDLFLVCQPSGGQPGTLYTSTDSGSTWRSAGLVNAQGTATSLAVAPTTGTVVLATSAGIYYYPAGTHRWQSAVLATRAPTGGFSFVGMTTSSEGVAVATAEKSQLIYITADGGLTWHARTIG